MIPVVLWVCIWISHSLANMDEVLKIFQPNFNKSCTEYPHYMSYRTLNFPSVIWWKWHQIYSADAELVVKSNFISSSARPVHVYETQTLCHHWIPDVLAPDSVFEISAGPLVWGLQLFIRRASCTVLSLYLIFIFCIFSLVEQHILGGEIWNLSSVATKLTTKSHMFPFKWFLCLKLIQIMSFKMTKAPIQYKDIILPV